MAKSPQNRFSTFDQILESLQSARRDSKPWEATNDEEVNRYVNLYQERRAIYLRQVAEGLSGADVYEMPGGREIHVGFGDLTQQNVDALVSSDDGALTMGGGVSAALLAAAGPALKQEAQRYVPVRAGRAVVTSAGDLPARFIFHAVTLGVADQRCVVPSRDLILDLMESCFYHADTLRVSSIAFPLLGTGAGRFSPEICLDTMFRFLARKLLRAATDVRTARIVLWRD